MKANLFTIVLLLFSTAIFAQTENDKKILMDSLWKETTDVANYKYYRIIKDFHLEKEIYKIMDYYKSGVLQMEGMSKSRDENSKIGEFIYYYENGNKKSISNYKDSAPIGKYFEWYENGNKKEESEHTGEDWKTGRNYKINQFWNKENIQTVIDGNGIYGKKNDFFGTGTLVNGYKNGEWKIYSKDDILINIEKYENGKFISGIAINSDNTKTEYFELEKQPVPKKGIQDFYKFIGKNFSYTNEAYKLNIKGKIFVQFVVDAEGEIVEAKVVKGLGYGLDEEAIRVITHYSKWIPGEQRGKKVRCVYTIPIVLPGVQ